MGMPSRARVLDVWRKWLEENGIDPLEPQCWCCFRPLKKSRRLLNLAKMANPSWTEIRRAWNDYESLQRCHIVAKSLGGTDDPENIFLMCKKCHDRAPATTSRELFLRWVSSQCEVNEIAEMWYQFKKTLQDFGVDSDEELLELNGIFASHEFKVWVHDNTGIHGGTTKMSTLVAALLEFRNQHNRQNATQSVQEQLRFPFDDR